MLGIEVAAKIPFEVCQECGVRPSKLEGFQQGRGGDQRRSHPPCDSLAGHWIGERAGIANQDTTVEVVRAGAAIHLDDAPADRFARSA